MARRNFHGRTTTIVSASTDTTARNGFGPFTPGFEVIEYNDINAVEKAVANPNVCAFLVEPIQGEAGVFVPQEGYLKQAAELCKKNNVLLITDEIQTGLARTGKMLASHYENVRADILILGKALSGGMMPVSVALADNEVMDVIHPGEHGSTFGGNPLASVLVREALQIIMDEKLVENSFRIGKQFRDTMAQLIPHYPLLSLVRGKGLMNALVINDSPDSETAWNFCLTLAEHGLLAKPTHGNIIRLTPPLCMTESQMNEACAIIEQSLKAHS